MSSNAGLSHVDPTPPRGFRAAVLRALASPLNAAIERSLPFRLIMWRGAPRLFRLLRPLLPFPAAVLETTDARNGSTHRRAVIYFHDGPRVIVVASAGGYRRDPHWLDNARADPSVRLAGEPFRAEVVDETADQTRLWRIADAFYPANVTYRAHAERHGRTIPLLQLVPVT